MNWKKRVVSIILLMATIITILPAEQVFAAEIGRPTFIHNVGAPKAQWGVVTHLADKKNNAVTYAWCLGDSKDLMELVDSKVSLTVSKDKDSIYDVITDCVTDKGWDSEIDYWYSVIDANSAAWRVRSGLSPHSFNGKAMLGLDTCTDADVNNFKAYAARTVITTEDGFSYYIADAIGSENIYRYDYCNSFDTDGIAEKSSSSSWIYQRVWCDYNDNWDKFIYTIITYINVSSDRDYYAICGYVSDTLDIVGLKTKISGFDSSKGEAHKGSMNDYNDSDDEIENVIEDWLNSPATLDKYESSLQRELDKRVQLGAITDTMLSGKDIVINTEPSLDKKYIGWYSSADAPSFALALGSMNASNTWPSSGLASAYKLVIDESASAEAEGVVFDVDARVYYYMNDMSIDSADYLWASEVTLDDVKDIKESDDNGEECSINLKDNISITECKIVWGTDAKISIEDGKTTNFWKSLICSAYGYRNALKIELSAEEKAIKTAVYNSSTFNDGLLTGLGKVLAKMNEMKLDCTYDSNTGVNVYELLKNTITDNKITVNVNNVRLLGTSIDWKTLYTSKNIPCDTLSDAIYVLTYLTYLNNVGYIEDDVSVVLKRGTVEVALLFDGELCDTICTQASFNKFVDEEGTLVNSSNLVAGRNYFYCGSINYLLSIGSDWVWKALGFNIESDLTPLNKLLYNSNIALSGICSVTLPVAKSGNYSTAGNNYGSVHLTEDDALYVSNEIAKISSDFVFTGTIQNKLPYSYQVFMYGLFSYVWGGINESLCGFPEYDTFEQLIGYRFSRAKELEGADYGTGSDLDYLPRVPYLNTTLGDTTLNYLADIEYGLSVLDWSTYSDENSTSWEDLDKYLKGETESLSGDWIAVLLNMGSNDTVLQWAEAGVYDTVSDDYLCVFRTVISIKQICEHLAKINSCTAEEIAVNWSPVVLNYYRLYNSFEQIFSKMELNLTNYVMADYTYSNEVEPLGFVARFKDEQFSSQWKYGYAISSHYIPFQTNVYEISAIEALVDEEEWVTEFYYKYGFYRKALYVTTDSEAVVERVLTGKQSGTKIATLRDLLNYERDIELYIDQNFYNANELKVQLDKFIQNASSDSVFGSIFDAIALTPEIVLKTGGYTMYSRDLATNVKPIEEVSDDTEDTVYPYDSFLLSEEDILGEDGFLSDYEYSIQQPYGLVSAIYRTADIYNSVNRAAIKNKPVFTSSKNVVGVQSNNYENYRMFYNYVTLSSLQTLIDHETKLLVDLDAPIFIDIFGNIVTGDGYVIIPAAANATLAGAAFTPYSIGYATFVTNAEETVYSGMTNPFYDWLYGDDYEYLTGMKNLSGKSSTFRETCQNTGGGYMHLLMSGHTSMGTTTLTDGVASTMVTWDNLNVKLAVLKDLLMSVHYLNAANFWDDTHINMAIEVLRGAPMEHIDYEAEGINTDTGMTAWQAYWAYKVENLVNAIHTDSNGTEKSPTLSFTFSVLDIFHIESAEKIALLAVKCLLIGFLLLLAAMIVADATVGKMPLNTVWRIVVTCILTGTCISLTPVLADFSLSTTSRLLLQSEASEMLAMRAQKDAEGIEIGVTQTFPVESSTDIIVHVGTLDVAWYDQLLYSMYSSVDNSFEDLYREAAHGVPIANAPYTVRRGKELYIDIGHVMDTTVVQYDATKGVLTNHIAGHIKEEELSASYMLPYYVILDQLVANVNLYNQKYGIQPKNYSVNADGSIRTQDLTYAYFHSDEFLSDTYDILDMARWFNTNSSKIPFAPYFTEDDISSFNLSIWYPTQADANLLQNSVDALYDKARAYAVNNSEMLSYVSDAAYLKSLAMYLAVEFNSIFDVGIADAFEVKCLDTEDLLRYVIGTPNDVYKFANRTFARYAHEMGGADMSVSAGILYIMFCLTNAIKVASFLIVYITCIGSIIYHRVFKREDSYAMLGFFILIGELTIVNLIYSVLFKVCMNLTRWGVPPLLAIWLVIFFCLLMIVAFFMVGKNGAKNMKQLGRHEVEAVTHFFNNLSGRLHGQRAGAAPSEAVERTVGVLQAHDFSRHENDDFEGNNRDVDDLKAHDRRRRESRVTDDGND